MSSQTTPKPEVVDWVKVAMDCRMHEGPGYDKDKIIDGLCEQIAALRAGGV